MGITNSKVTGIQLPGQSGKTREMQEKLKEYMLQTRNQGCEDDLNIMFTSNSKLLVHQTSKRFDDDLGPSESDSADSNEYETDDDMIILQNGCSTWTSSVRKTTKELAYDILMGDVNMIVCCSNPKRYASTIDLISTLEKNKKFTSSINIWIDEAHKSIKIWEKYLYILNYKKIKKVTLVTASWDPIDKKFKIHRQPFEKTHPDVYRSLQECKWIIVDHPNDFTDDRQDDHSAPFYISHALSKPEVYSLITPGDIWLTPGNSKTATHTAIQEDLMNQGWNGLKLNGTEKSLNFYIDGETIDYEKYNEERSEVKDVLVKAFTEYPSLNEAPFFVTGLNCIKEGITFQSNYLHFRGGILPPIHDPSDAYQVACRLAGNIKGHMAYNPDEPCVIVTTSKMKKKIIAQENINLILPRILYNEGRTLPTEFDKRRAARGHVKHDPKGNGFRIFSDYHTFISFLKHLGLRSGFGDQPNGSGQYDGMFVCSVQSSRGATQMPRYVTEVIDKIDLAYGGSGAKKTGFPAYKDLNEVRGKVNPQNEDLVWIAVVHSDLDQKLLTEADALYMDESDEILKESKHYTEV
jgi:hypothetical protein